MLAVNAVRGAAAVVVFSFLFFLGLGVRLRWMGNTVVIPVMLFSVFSALLILQDMIKKFLHSERPVSTERC